MNNSKFNALLFVIFLIGIYPAFALAFMQWDIDSISVSSKIKWNFTKFLIDSNGNVIKRYSPITIPSKIEKDIQKLIHNGQK